MRPYTNQEYEDLPHVIMSNDRKWDPRKFDLDYPIGSNDHDTDLLHDRRDPHYTILGEYIGHKTTIDDDDSSLEDFISGEIFEDASAQPTPDLPSQDFWIPAADYDHSELVNRCMRSAYNIDLTSDKPRTHIPVKQDFTQLKRFFAWLPSRLIEHTFQNSTQYVCMPNSP